MEQNFKFLIRAIKEGRLAQAAETLNATTELQMVNELQEKQTFFLKRLQEDNQVISPKEWKVYEATHNAIVASLLKKILKN